MRQHTFIVIVVMAAATISAMWLPQYIDHIQATSKLIDTSTGEGTEQIVRSGTVGETAPAGTLAGVTLPDRRAPPAITDDNIYVAWWTNKTGNDEVMFRVSTDGGTTFSDKINLSNSTEANSQNVQIAADDDNVIITWWERNATSEEPVVIASTDNGATFGPILRLATNGTIGGSDTT